MTEEMAMGGRGATRVPMAVSRGRTRRGESGAVTAETAVVLPVLVALTLGLVWLIALGAAQVRVVDAAREAARLAARGESDAAAVQAASRVAPQGTSFSVSRAGQQVQVRAEVEVDGPGGLFAFLPGATVDSHAVAVREPGS